jgi:hypothetical protein
MGLALVAVSGSGIKVVSVCPSSGLAACALATGNPAEQR